MQLIQTYVFAEIALINLALKLLTLRNPIFIFEIGTDSVSFLTTLRIAIW
jgi:hypothetical protein